MKKLLESRPMSLEYLIRMKICTSESRLGV
jgi:hypothetical protein